MIPIITPELNRFTIENPVVYSDFNTDLDEKTLFWAQREYKNRWENTNILDLSGLFDLNKLTSSPNIIKVLTNDMVSILSPLAYDELQKTVLSKELTAGERAERWANIHLPKDVYYNLLIDNIDPAAFAQQQSFNENSTTIKKISERLNAVGVVTNYEEVKQALLTRYIKDTLAVQNPDIQYGLGGRLASMGGDLLLDLLKDPLNVVNAMITGSAGRAAGMAIGGAIGTGILFGTGGVKYSVPIALGVTKAAGISGELAGIAGGETALIHSVTNQRREDLGLEPLDLGSIFKENVLAGAVLSTAFAGIFLGGKALFRGIQSFKGSKPIFNRIVDSVQDIQGRYKNSKKPDTELLDEMQVASGSTSPFSDVQIKEFKLDPDFPRISDPSVSPEVRAFNNSIGTLMADTNFSADLSSQSAQKLKDFTAKMNGSELFLFSDGLAKARTYQDFYDPFIFSIKKSSTKNEFIAALRSLLFDEETKTIKQYLKTRVQSTHADAETHRNTIAQMALQQNIEGILEGIDAEEAAKITEETFLTENTGFSKGNPFAERAKSSETENRLAFDWERLRRRSEAYVGEKKDFNTKDLLLSKVEILNTFSAVSNGIRAEHGNNFMAKMSGISMEDLLDQWRPDGKDFSVKNILNESSAILREAHRKEGVEYGKIEDHIPQKWAPEKIANVSRETFVNDIYPLLNLDKTGTSYRQGTKDELVTSEKRLKADIKKFDENTKRRVKASEKRISDAEKTKEKSTIFSTNVVKKIIKESSELGKVVKKQFVKLETARDRLQFESETSKSHKKEQKKVAQNVVFLEKIIKVSDLNLAKNKALLSSSSKELADAKKIAEQTQASGVTRAQLASASKLVNAFQQRNLAANVLKLRDVDKQLSKADIAAENKLQVRMYNFLKSLDLVPERPDSRAFLTDEDLIAANTAIEKIPERLTEANQKRINQMNYQNALMKYRNITKYVRDRNKAQEQIFDVLVNEDVALKDRISNWITRSSKSKIARRPQEITSKRESLFKKIDELLKEKVAAKDLLNELESEKDILTKSEKLEVKEFNEMLNASRKRAIKAIEEGEDVVTLDKINKRFSSNEERINEIVLNEDERFKKFLDKQIQKARKNIENTQNRKLTKSIIRKFEYIEALEKQLAAPFSREDLTQIYDNILTDDLRNPSTSSTVPHKKRRILHFLDVDAFNKANQKYGTTPDFRILVQQEFNSLVREIARVKTFKGSSQFFKNELEADLKLVLGDRQMTGNERLLKQIVDANIQYVEGVQNKSATFLSAMGEIYLSLIRNAALGGAGLTTFFDDAHSVAFTGAQNGFGFLRSMSNYIDGITKIKLSKEEAARMLVVLDDISTVDEALYRFPTEKSVAKLQSISRGIDKFTFAINGVEYLTNRGRLAFNRMFLKELGSLRSEKNLKFRETLKSYGITAEDIATINKLLLDEDGIPVFDDQFKLGDTYTRMLRSIYGESRRAISATSQSMKAVLATEGSAGFSLGILNSLFFLKRIPLQVSFDRMLLPIMRGEIGQAAKFFLQNLLVTTARLTLKYLAMGYTPNFSDPAFYREVLLQNASMIPFIQPFFSMDKVDSRNVSTAVGRSFLGAYSPLVNLGTLIADLKPDESDPRAKRSRTARDALRVVRDFTPIKTHPALAFLYERYLFDNIQLATDPNAHKNIAKIEEYRTKSGKIRIF